MTRLREFISVLVVLTAFLLGIYVANRFYSTVHRLNPFWLYTVMRAARSRSSEELNPFFHYSAPWFAWELGSRIRKRAS